MALQEIRERSSRAERRLRRFVASLNDGPNANISETPKSVYPPKHILENTPGPSFDYFGFEERFRGNEGDIKERQRVYVEFFKDVEPVLDIGCGRGEFLELSTEAGIKAKGVDLDLDMVLYCQEKGLDVVRVDAFAYLAALPDASLGGIFAAQVVEHLEPTRIIELANLCHRKLQMDGVLIFETPNPICLTVFARSFYMDLSHIRPIHPEAMKFLFESVGFTDLQVRFSAPVEASMRIPPLSGATAGAKEIAEFNQGIERLNELLYGFQDFAVIGKKSSRL
jgi:O-antigen chain-terminating methyltransferase